MKKIIFINTQFALFFSKSIERPEILLPDFIKEMGDVFDQSPLTIPVLNSPEFGNVPIVQFTSSNGLHACSFARQRADYYHFSSDTKKQYNFDEIKDDFINNVEKYFNFFSIQTKINRIGFLTKFFVKDEQQGKIIANLIDNNFKNIHGGDVRGAKLQYISRIKIKSGEFILNNSTTIEKTKTVLFEDSKKIPQDGILITRDFNTIPEKTEEYKEKFTIEKVKQIIKEGEENFKLDEISKLLWTEEK